MKDAIKAGWGGWRQWVFVLAVLRGLLLSAPTSKPALPHWTSSWKRKEGEKAKQTISADP